MKKKVLVTLLIVALAVASVSAAKSSGIKVGVELGVGIDTFKSKVTGTVLGSESTTTFKYKNSGFATNLKAEYAIDENWSVKVDGGIMIAGKATWTTSESDTKTTASETSGVYGNVALDGKYTAAINKQFSASAFAGLELAVGHIYKTGSEDADKKLNNVAFGLNFGGEFAYAINKQFSIVAGCDFAWFFVNANDTYKNDSGEISISGSTLASTKVSNTSLSLRPYVGAAYAF